MMGLAWISVTTIGGVAVPVRVEDIDRVAPNGTGSRIIYKDDPRNTLDVTDSPASIFTKIDTLRTDFNTALGNP